MNKGCFSVEAASREGGSEAKRASGGSTAGIPRPYLYAEVILPLPIASPCKRKTRAEISG